MQIEAEMLNTCLPAGRELLNVQVTRQLSGDTTGVEQSYKSWFQKKLFRNKNDLRYHFFCFIAGTDQHQINTA